MIFVTGGAGYIGTHACVELLNAGLDVTVFDNFSNSQPEALLRVERITGRSPRCIKGDIRDSAALTNALRDSGATAVIHFAGLKAVGESVEKPLTYYDNNVVGTVRLLEAMTQTGVKTLVFSSSATVYGDPQRLPLTEDHLLLVCDRSKFGFKLRNPLMPARDDEVVQADASHLVDTDQHGLAALPGG